MPRSARKNSRSSGRGSLTRARRPSTRSMRVPGLIAPTSKAWATSRAASAASRPPTPARSSTWEKLSERPKVAVSSMRGRSGVSASGRTAAVAPMRRPVSAPSASGVIAWADNAESARSPPEGASANTGRMPGDRPHTAARSAVSVPMPRHQRRLPIAWPRSGARSMADRRRRTGAGGSASASDSCAPPAPPFAPTLVNRSPWNNRAPRLSWCDRHGRASTAARSPGRRRSGHSRLKST